VCGRSRPCHGAKSGRPVCASCRPRPRQRCDRCARVRPISAHWPIGAVCSLCYDQVRANPGPCTDCEKTSPLIAGEPDKPTCGPCAGFDVNYECAGCGHATLLFRDGYCHRCILTGRLAHLLAGPEQTISPQLAPLAVALAAVDKPHTVLIWLGYSPTARLLVDLAATGQPITHARLDTLKPSKAVHYIRDVLVTAGVLPERDELLERVPAFVDDLLSGQPEIARIIKPYAQWFLLRRTRQRRRTPLTSKGAAQKLWSDQVRAAATLLDWLADQNLSLAELNQDLLDRWLVEHPTRHDAVVNFITWTSRHHLNGQLRVARRPRSAPNTFLTDTEHTDQLRRCLHDHDIPIEYRAAGTLALLFGLPMNRITQLRTDQIIRTDTARFLALGAHHMRLPPRVATIVDELLNSRPRWQVLERHNTPSPWLFPGQAPTRPASAAKIHGGLRRHGITVLAGRNTARTALAAELPAAVLADLTGININTAVTWSRQVKRDWTEYVALRAQDAPASNKPGLDKTTRDRPTAPP
jgi:hypothetical protein